MSERAAGVGGLLVWNARGLETMKWKGGSDVARLIDWQQENNLGGEWGG